MNTREGSNGWRVTALILGGLVVVSLICLVGCILGGMIGFSLGKREGMRSHRPYEYMPGPGPFMIPPDSPDAPVIPEMPEMPDMPEREFSGRPWLGVTFMSTEEGAQISQVVPGSPADEAGVRVGDLIVEVDGRSITLARPLSDVVSRYDPGDWVMLTVLRNGDETELEVELGQRPGFIPEEP